METKPSACKYCCTAELQLCPKERGEMDEYGYKPNLLSYAVKYLLKFMHIKEPISSLSSCIIFTYNIHDAFISLIYQKRCQ